MLDPYAPVLVFCCFCFTCPLCLETSPHDCFLERFFRGNVILKLLCKNKLY